MYLVIKRLFDIILTSIALVILLPLFIVIAILVKINLKGRVIFIQKRIGQYGKIFTMYKFKTMLDLNDSNGEALSDEERLTKFGQRLRKTSLDELPQLWNVLKGDMTLIGPRPKTVLETLLMRDTKYIYRLAVKPGLTSLAIVNGRNNIPHPESFEYDLIEAKSKSFVLDFKIFLKTIPMVISGKDVSAEDKATYVHYKEYLLENNLITQDELCLLVDEARKVTKYKKLQLKLTNEKFKDFSLKRD